MNPSAPNPIDPQSWARPAGTTGQFGVPQGSGPDPDGTPSILQDVVRLLWASRWAIGSFALAGAIGGVVVALAWPPRFGAFASFIPEQSPGSRLSSALGGLTSQLGLSLASDPAQSSRFYADLLLSRQVMEQVVRARFQRGGAEGGTGDSLSLLEHFGIRSADSSYAIERGVRKLRAAVTVQPDIRTNIVRVVVRLRNPELAAAVANKLLHAVNEFNTLSRQSQASRRRAFVETQTDSAERELRGSEDRLKVFLEQNRAWQQSPELQHRWGQLQRQVDIDKEVYLTLRRNLETARIDEVNDVPLISVIDVAVPTRDRTPRRRVIAILGLLVGVVAGLAQAYAAWYLRTVARAEPR